MRYEGTRNHRHEAFFSNDTRQPHSRQLSTKNSGKDTNWSSTRYRPATFRKSKAGPPNQLRTSRKFKITTLKNTNILGGEPFNGVAIKPQIANEAPLFDIGNGSRGNIRQSYDNSQK